MSGHKVEQRSLDNTSSTVAAPVPSARRYEADAAMLFAVVIWAFNFTIIKVALSTFSPLAFTAVRFTLALLTMIVLLRLRGETLAVERRDLLGIVAVGLVGHPLYQWLFTNGLARTSPGNASLLLGIAPIFVALYGQLSGAERASRIVWGGVVTTFAGMVLVIAGGAGGLQLGGRGATGDLLVLVSAALWAFFTAGSNRYVRHYSPLKVTTLGMAFGVPVIIMISIPDLLRQDWGAIPAGHWGSVLYSSVLALVVGYTLWATSLHRVGNTRTAIYTNLTPVLAIAIAWITLGTALTPLQIAGVVIVITGLVLTRQGRVRRA